MIKFQDSGSLSNSEWAEFGGAITHLKDFTVCHLDKLQFFNMNSHSIWNYCTIMSMESSMYWMQLWYKRDHVTAGRNIELGIKMRNQVGYFNMKPFNHRSWNFFCWAHESKSGENKLYLNGKLQEVKTFDAEMEMNGSSEVYGVYIHRQPRNCL